MAKSFPSLAFALIAWVLLSMTTLSNSFSISLPTPRLNNRRSKKPTVYSSSSIDGTSAESKQLFQPETEDQGTEKQPLVPGASVRKISTALVVAFLISGVSIAQNAGVAGTVLAVRSGKMLSAGALVVGLRKALGIIPGLLMLKFGRKTGKAETTTTTEIANGSLEALVENEPIELELAKPVVQVEVVKPATIEMDAKPMIPEISDILLQEATSDLFPLMDRKYVKARKSMRFEGAANRAAKKYAKIESLEDKAFQILLDLGMAKEHEPILCM